MASLRSSAPVRDHPMQRFAASRGQTGVECPISPLVSHPETENVEVSETMHQVWVMAVLLQVILWSQPYVRDGDF
jgi:hypothetical protein